MAKPQITIINAESGEEITRDATAAEIAQIKFEKFRCMILSLINKFERTKRNGSKYIRKIF